jgi:signal transduction histidine kinase
MICSGVCRLLLIADLLAESPTSSDPNIRSGLLSGGHAKCTRAAARVAIETRVEVGVKAGPELIIKADADQLEQLLINLLRNAVDAALETDGRVELSWSTGGDQFQMVVTDEGPGLPTDTGNLFVPFYTTKPGGSGIGLALCLQIAEGHGGTLTLENAATGRGVRTCLTLPLEVGRSTAPRTQKRGRLS